MPTDFQTALYFLGRLLLGGAFVVFGVRNIRNLDGLTAAMVKKNVPQARALIMVGIGIQIIGGLMVATGVLAAWGAAALIAFLILAVYLFHDFWTFPAAEQKPHINAWIMNLALSGGFLLVIATTP